MTTTEMQKEVGQVLKRNFTGLWVMVKVNDVKISYGVKRYFVSVEGQESNQVWINA